MAEQTIPVDLYNPGQVFACLGLLEAADVLLSPAAGGFDWSNERAVTFRLQTGGDENPVAAVLEFLAGATVRRVVPDGYMDPPAKKASGVRVNAVDDDEDSEDDAEAASGAGSAEIEFTDAFPAPEADRMSLPMRLGGGNRPTVELGHWADGSSRNSFKLYAGNRSATGIAGAMLFGVREQPKKTQAVGDLRIKGIRQLWEEQRDELIERPFDVLTPMGGSFNFDPHGAWTAIEAGYSPNRQHHRIEASPVVELLAAWGLENARPDEFETRKVRYAAWGMLLPPILARAALSSGLGAVPLKHFLFELDLSGKNKVVTFAELEG